MSECPFKADTPRGALCDARNAPCYWCDFEVLYPHCELLGDRCTKECADTCPCRTCGEVSRERCAECAESEFDWCWCVRERVF